MSTVPDFKGSKGALLSITSNKVSFGTVILVGPAPLLKYEDHKHHRCPTILFLVVHYPMQITSGVLEIARSKGALDSFLKISFFTDRGL